MKTIDKLILKNFLGPFILTFFIVLFVFVMQFLWKYVDDLVGKGLEITILVELLFYASARLVPIALPLAILLSSIMTLGNFGEHFELTAVKASGISLMRFLRGLIIFVGCAALGTFFFSNYLLPRANLKFSALMYDVRHQKPTLNIQSGVFDNSIDGLSLRAESKDPDGNTLYGLAIYDHSKRSENKPNVLLAKEGVLEQDDSVKVLSFKLKNGVQYQEEIDPKAEEQRFKHYRIQFKTWKKNFDLSQFELNRTDEELFKNFHQMMNVFQLSRGMDTLTRDIASRRSNLRNTLRPYLSLAKKTVMEQPTPDSMISTIDPAIDSLYFDQRSLSEQTDILKSAHAAIRSAKNYIKVAERDLHHKHVNMRKHKIEFHRKFTLSVACLVLFFIGAPLGSIIKKGGLGWPIFWAILFFVLLHVTSLTGEKMAQKETIAPAIGMWLPSIILLPMGVWLTIKAKNDSALFDFGTYTKWLKRSSN